MALHVQTTDDIDENCIYVNHSFLFILGDIEDRSELDLKKPTLAKVFIKMNSIDLSTLSKITFPFSHLI